jgi:hypothetical protein
VTLAPGAIDARAPIAALVFAQSDASGSATVTFVSRVAGIRDGDQALALCPG